jgi:hypothetical protein
MPKAEVGLASKSAAWCGKSKSREIALRSISETRQKNLEQVSRSWTTRRDVRLAARDAVKFLRDYEADGMKLENCPEYVREWMERGKSCKATRKKPGLNKFVVSFIDTGDVSSPLDAAKRWLRNSNVTDRFEFGGVKGCFSTMEIHRNGRPVILTCKEFKTLAYLIKNPRRVISRDELLNEVWGYENYPRTRTVDNHILRLRKKLETESARPKHFHTVHNSGYKFLP